MEMEMELELEKMSDSKYSTNGEVSLPGFRFHPTDEELVGFYLRRKVEKKPLSIELIKQIDIYKHDPWDLPKATTAGEREWYFFCRRGRKYRNSVRPNRVTSSGSGFWKATGIDKPVYSSGDTHGCIGLKKSLVYYTGSAGKGTKTDWMMHEFRLPFPEPTNLLNAKSNTHEAEVWTVCRIFKRNGCVRKYVSHWPADTSSKTCSSDSDNKDNSGRSTISVTMENGNKPVNDQLLYERNQLFAGTQLVPFPAAYMSFANSNIGGENWDELRSIVDCAYDHASFQH
ncbi:hypothetical protein F0562_019530 [Nyssa sinensis]|uniref:NAC domain-containing protein n=1 Tax=Nyssa sinensis TaxID=561372 RepID=A0A5J5BQ00_9ASTE|nr:hypothetical protein F0562_019530 [Nyssa sinensis]